LLIAAATLVVVLGMFYLIGAPLYARHRIDRMLLDWGVPNPQYALRRISLREIEILNVRLGEDDWLTADRIRVRYDAVRLLGGRVESVDIIGATYTVNAADGEMNFGFKPAPRRGEYRDPFTFSTIRLQDCHFVLRYNGGSVDVSMSGHLAAATENSLTANLNAQVLDQSLDLTGKISTGADHTSVQASIAPFAIMDPRIVASLAPTLKGLQASGRCAIDAEIHFDDNGMHPLVTLSVNDGMIAHPDWPLAIASADSTLVFDSVSPFSTRGPQRIDIKSATTGEIDITSASVLFDLENPASLLVHEGQWTLSDGGRFRVASFSLNPQQPRIATTVTCENLDLNFWLKLVSQDRADGEGRLRGEFAIDWNPTASPRLQFTTGSLVADPPTGFIRTHDAQRLGALLDQQNTDFTVDQTLRHVKQQIIDALEDFGYTSLRLEFIPDGRDTTLQAHLKGKGRRGPNPQEFAGLVVNMNHFGEALEDALSFQSAMSRLQLMLRPGGE
jgi:hypothetical protein